MLPETFSIPLPDIWHATTYDHYLPQGRTLPLIVTAERRNADGTTEEKQFVTKAIGHPGISDVDLFAELFGNLLAQHFGLTTCEPHIIAFTEDFVASTISLLPAKVKLKVGYGVGCVFTSPLFPIVSDFKMSSVSLLKQAALLYGFDLLCVNPDRKRTNANCAIRGDQLIVFDFNEAFHFLNSTYGPPAWRVTANGIGASHICQPGLRQHSVNWTPFIAALTLLQEPQMQALVKDFPPQWQVYISKVIDHVLEAKGKSNTLLSELQRSLTI